MEETRSVRWCYANEYEAEDWTGDFETREQAVTAAFAKHRRAKVLWVRRTLNRTASHFAPTVEQLRSVMVDNVANQVAEDAEGVETYPEWSEVQKEELQALLNAWLDKNTPTNFRTLEGDAERVEKGSPGA